MPDILQNGNGDLFYPSINVIQYYSTFSQGQKDIFVWIGSDNLALENNDDGMTPSGYPDIT